MKLTLLAGLLVVGSFLLFTLKASAAIPKAGDTAPLFTGVDQDGKEFQLDNLIGKKVVLLYFYPKDFTSGCTKEACGLRDRMGDLKTNNVEVIGVSHDSAASHKKFVDEY